MKFNTATVNTTKTTNLAGGQAYKEDPRLEFVSILLTSFVKDSFYRKAGDAKAPEKDTTLSRVCELVEQIPDKKFLAKAAVYARNEFGMRSISHVVAGELAKRVKKEQWSKYFYNRVVRRVDDITEILAYYLNKYNKPVPNSLKKGLAMAIARQDEYTLAKYRAEDKTVKLVDAVNLVHPKGGEKSTVPLKALVEGTLKATATWETKLSSAGQRAESEEEKAEFKAEAWRDLLSSGRLGQMAAIKNARNILEQAPDSVDALVTVLTDEQAIRKSLVLPFRYATAMDEMEKVPSSGKVMAALSKALDISCANVPKFEGKTLVALDCSGSMQGDPAKIGSLFAAVLVKSNNADLIVFSSNAAYRSVNPMDSTLTIAKSIRFASGGTNFHAIFQTANVAYDRVILLSDMQAWDGEGNYFGHTPHAAFAEYKKRTGAKPKVYSWDIAGLGTLQFPEKDIYCLAGWSDKALDILQLLETDKQALIHKIEAVEF